MPHHKVILGHLELCLPHPSLHCNHKSQHIFAIMLHLLLLCKAVLAMRTVADSDSVANAYQWKTELISFKKGSLNHRHYNEFSISYSNRSQKPLYV